MHKTCKMEGLPFTNPIIGNHQGAVVDVDEGVREESALSGTHH